MIVSLDEIKKHLNIDPWFNDDDEYLEQLEQVSKEMVEMHLGYSCDELEYDYGVIPAPVKHAILLMIGNLYNNRESVSTLTIKELPLSYQYLLQKYKNYKYNMED